MVYTSNFFLASNASCNLRLLALYLRQEGNKMKKKKFTLPQSFLTQLSEFTNGFFLAVINENGDFDVYEDAKTAANELAMINFLDIHSQAIQEMIRQRAIEESIGESDDDASCEEQD